MTAFLQSVFAFVLGLALSFFGLVHSVSRSPGAAVFGQFTAMLPALGSVLFFGLGVVASVGGLTLLTVSAKRLRHRWRLLREMTSRRVYHPHPDHDDGGQDDRQWVGAYR